MKIHRQSVPLYAAKQKMKRNWRWAESDSKRTLGLGQATIGLSCRHKEVFGRNKFHAGLTVFTAVMVPATDFLTGVLSALTIFLAGCRFFDKPDEVRKSAVIADAAAKQQGIVSALGTFNSAVVPLAMADDNDHLLRYAAHLQLETRMHALLRAQQWKFQ